MKKWKVEVLLRTNTINGESVKQLERASVHEYEVGSSMRKMIDRNVKHTKKVFNQVELNVYNQNDIRVAWHLVQSV